METLFPDTLVEISGRGPAPDTSFYYFSVTKSQVIWRWWKISPRLVDRRSKPGEEKESHPEFLEDKLLQREVCRVFGPKLLQFAKALCQGHYNYLDRLPDALLLRIISFLELEDVGQLGQTSHRFRQLCGSEQFWEQALRQRCNTVSAEVASLALEVGWRSVFFTNKLQLQKLLSRRRQTAEEPQEDHLPDSDPEAEESEQEPPVGSEEEPPSDTICHPDPDPGTDDPSCDDDPDPDESSGSTEVLPDLFREDLRFCEEETLNSEAGDCCTVKTPT